jgi:antitoxin component of MazEF toxin-antitoxin module
METIRQVVNADGLQIPLPLVARYGLQPGARVTLEFDEQGIHIFPTLPDKQDIENMALQYLLTNLGDAITVQVMAKDDGLWQAIVYSEGLAEPLGQLTYSQLGQLQPDQSTEPKVMRESAINAYQSK